MKLKYYVNNSKYDMKKKRVTVDRFFSRLNSQKTNFPTHKREGYVESQQPTQPPSEPPQLPLPSSPVR